MVYATKRAAPRVASFNTRSMLKSQCPSGLVLAAHRQYRCPPCTSGRLYSPSGCGCALLMAPVMAAAMGLAALSLGFAALAVAGLVLAIILTVREVRRVRGGACARPGFAVAAGVLYLLSVPYLMFFIWLWFMD